MITKVHFADNVFFCIFSVLIPGSETLLDWDLRRLEVMTFTAAVRKVLVLISPLSPVMTRWSE